MPTRPPKWPFLAKPWLGATYGAAMQRPPQNSVLAEAAALARIDELGGAHGDPAKQPTPPTTRRRPPGRCGGSVTTTASRRQIVWDFGPELVAACGIARRSARARRRCREGERRAARRRDGRPRRRHRPHAGESRRGSTRARSTRARARMGRGRRRGPSFERRRFDVVTSSLRGDVRARPPGGRRRAAPRLPSGRHDRDGELHARRRRGRVLRDLRAYAPPPPPGALPPVLWGSEEHVRDLFGDRVDALELTRTSTWSGPRRPSRLRRLLPGGLRPRRRASPARRDPSGGGARPDFRDFATRANSAAEGEPAEYDYEYLLVVART